jgi:hypothetical protein
MCGRYYNRAEKQRIPYLKGAKGGLHKRSAED